MHQDEGDGAFKGAGDLRRPTLTHASANHGTVSAVPAGRKRRMEELGADHKPCVMPSLAYTLEDLRFYATIW